MEIKKDDLAKIVVPVPPLPVQEEFNRIVSEEHLKTGIAEQFIIDCFKEGYVDTDGTRIVSMLPPVSRFAPSNAYELMKSRVVERFRQYFDRFVGM